MVTVILLFTRINIHLAFLSISGIKLLKLLEFTVRRGVKVSFVTDILMRRLWATSKGGRVASGVNQLTGGLGLSVSLASPTQP